jgi:hypothetical protein
MLIAVFFPYFLTLKIEAVCSSETLLNFRQATRRNMIEGSIANRMELNLEKPPVAHLLKKYPKFCGTPRFIHNSLSPVRILNQINPVTTTTPYPSKIHTR